MMFFPYRHTARLPSLALLCTAVSATTATADTQLQELDIQASQLEESVPLTLEHYGNQLEVISAEQIRAGGFVDITDALRTLVPGLHISPKHGPFDYFNASLHGSRNQDILWLVDGVRITNRLYNSTSPLDTLPPQMVARIEVLKGGQGIFYGTQSVGGVINIITREFSDDTAGEVGAGVHSNDGYNLHGAVSGRAGDHQYVLYASHDDADGHQPFEDDAIEPSATDKERGYSVTTAGLKYAWTINPDTRLSAQYQISDADLDFGRPYLNHDTINARSETLLSTKFETRVNDRVQLFLKAYRHTWDTDYTRIYNVLDDNGNLTGETRVVNDDTYWGYKDYGFNAMLEWAVAPQADLVVGFDQQNYRAEDDVWRIADEKEQVNAVFAQVRSTPQLFENTVLALGVRNNRPSESRDSTVWNLSGKHALSDRWYVQGNLGTSFRLPDAEALFLRELDDLDNDGVPDGGWFAVGNPDLKPERSRNVNLSVGYAGDRAQVELTVFRRDIDDYINSYVPFTIAGVESESFENSDDEVNVRGAELQVDAPVTGTVHVNASFTYTRALFNDEGQQLDDIPRRQAKLGVDYRPLSERWGAGLHVIYVGDVNDREQRDRYTVADLTGFMHLDAAGKHRISARVENITDKTYATSVGRGTRDNGDNYLYDNIGVPRTFHLSYRYAW